MSTITTIAAGDLISDSRAVINTNFSNLNTDKEEASKKDTDTTMAANSDTKYPSQKAVKTYIDTSGGANASETARGIVEEATDAEVTAGTATGGTGAKLFITPAKLVTQALAKVASSAALLEASGADVNITNTVTETNIFSVSIPAGRLSTNKAVRGYVHITNARFLDTSAILTLRLKYGGTTLITMAIDPSAATGGSHKGELHFMLFANAATNAQSAFLRARLRVETLDPADATQEDHMEASAVGTATEDSTGALNLVLSAQWATADADNDFQRRGYIVEMLA